ncbi:MAG: phosphatase [Flavobacterium sp. MedPE-SWcel]|uniref:alkaline phosphatase PhoX n=1 Tax=uncultured Flavobacterium sp. TaxID=165435 RepID=UPI000915E4CB|nr:alkaline phosphatase PhoX [uncultured Flavobacterium sp.]OIQ18695.1 MAG: phosphatase [Flavobacterium sp. MedPE-SWcel]
MKKNYLAVIGMCAALGTLVSCNNDDDNKATPNPVELANHSTSPNIMLKKASGFSNLNIYNILSSEDVLEDSPAFVYGSMADGAGLLKNDDGTFSLINNIEADYAVARITFDETFKPVKGEYILNSAATAGTAQCSGTLITPQEHGFGPLYLSGGEWGGSSKAVFATDPFRSAADASTANILTKLGQWTCENAVPIGKDAYSDKTVVFIGDDQGDNTTPSGQLGMYVGNSGDLYGGQLYGLKMSDASINFEMDMTEGQSYPVEFVSLEETEVDLLDAECKNKGVMGFSRLEDIDWRRGSAANQREIYFCVTGRKKPDLVGKGTIYGRVYKLVLNENDPTGAGTLTCILDGDKLDGIAKAFHSPDNITVTENYVYIQEDPNGYADTPDKTHYARLYQYNISTGALKTVLECDQDAATAAGYGNTDKMWEITGMIDISDIIGKDNTFAIITQNHGWEPADGSAFTDPNATTVEGSRKEGSMLYVIEGLER